MSMWLVNCALASVASTNAALDLIRAPFKHFQDLWISQTELPKAQLYKLNKINHHIQDISAGLNQRREVDLCLQNDTENWERGEEVGQPGWRGLTFVMGEEVMSEGGGRACVAVAGAQRGAELQHSCQPLREEEQRSRTKGKKEDGRSTHEQRRKEKKLRRKRKARKGHARPKCGEEVSLIRTLCWNPIEAGLGTVHLTHLVCGSAGETWIEGVCSYGGGRPESRWSPDWWISEWCVPSCHSNPTAHTT